MRLPNLTREIAPRVTELFRRLRAGRLLTGITPRTSSEEVRKFDASGPSEADASRTSEADASGASEADASRASEAGEGGALSAAPASPAWSDELAAHLALGRRGEEFAAAHLARAGYRLVASNFKLNVGRNRRGAMVQAEIDLVAYERSTLCFVEVKTRASDWFTAPESNVDLRKQRQISRAARAYRRIFGLTDAPYRYDVVSLVLPPADSEGHTPAPRLRLLRNFWTDEKFRKRRWTE